MQVATHESFARRMAAHVGERMPADALVEGALAPAHGNGWPQRHHVSQAAARALTRCVRKARRHYLVREYRQAAYELGVAAHYALDSLVPYADQSQEHSAYESELARLDRDLAYTCDLESDVADGRLAERAIAQIDRLSATSPGNKERRLLGANEALLRLAAAVAEEREPMGLIGPLADSLVSVASRVGAWIFRYRRHAEPVFQREVAGCWDWRGDGEPRLRTGRPLRRAVAVYEVLRSRRHVPPLHVALLRRLCVGRLRRAMLRLLDRALGPEADPLQMRGRVKEAMDACVQTVRRIRKRRSHWDWFEVRWDYWLSKGRQVRRQALRALRECREAPARRELREFAKACIAELLEEWPDSRLDRPGRLYRESPGAKAVPYALPPIGLMALGGVAWAAGALPLWAAALSAGAAAGAYLLYARRVVGGLEVLSACAEAAVRRRQHRTGPDAGEEAT